MSDESKLPFHKRGELSRSRGLFNTAMGPLQRQLRQGEYNLLKFSPMFESDFVQISKKGGALDVHNQVQLVRVAIAATNPKLQIPNVLLLARPVLSSRERRLSHQTRVRHSPRPKFELTRLLPLCFVKISIHDHDMQQLRFKLISGRTFYLQLCPPQDVHEDLFGAWIKIVHLLRPQSNSKLKLQEQAAEPGQELEATQQAKDLLQAPQKSEVPLGRVDEETPRVNSALQEQPKEKETEPSQDLQTIQEDTQSSTSLPSQDEATEEESPLPPEDEGPKQQLKETSEGNKERRRKSRSPTSRKNTKKSKSHRSQSSQRAISNKFYSLLVKSFSNISRSDVKAATKGKGRKP